MPNRNALVYLSHSGWASSVLHLCIYRFLIDTENGYDTSLFWLFFFVECTENDVYSVAV